MLSVTNKPILVIVIMLIVVMLIVIMLIVVMLNVIMLRVIMLSVVAPLRALEGQNSKTREPLLKGKGQYGSTPH